MPQSPSTPISTDPTALEINLKPGITPTAGKHLVEEAIGQRPGLTVQTFNERKAHHEASIALPGLAAARVPPRAGFQE